MTNGEHQAVAIADRWVGDISEMDKIKKLGEEFTEFIEALLTKSDEDILDEAGDMTFLILHILSKRIPPEKINLTNLVVNAADKMEMRNYKRAMAKTRNG